MCSLPWEGFFLEAGLPKRLQVPPSPGKSSLARPRGPSACPQAALCRERRPGQTLAFISVVFSKALVPLCHLRGFLTIEQWAHR